jgi:hypothetical protein
MKAWVCSGMLAVPAVPKLKNCKKAVAKNLRLTKLKTQ